MHFLSIRLDTLVSLLIHFMTTKVSKHQVYVRSSLLLYIDGKGALMVGCGIPNHLIPTTLISMDSCATSCGKSYGILDGGHLW